jgi:thiamine-monophosphate kinase
LSSEKLSETELIKRLFLPLARNYKGALNLGDDAALIPDHPGLDTVITTDCLVEGVHFLSTDPPAAVAARALRSNLSDLAAMGACPHVYTMAISIPGHIDIRWLEAFAAQLDTDQRAYNIHLAGGDTVATPGPLNISITAMGHVPTGSATARSGASPGDGIYVTGTIGDAALGLKLLTGQLSLSDDVARDFLIDRFHFPTARIETGITLREQATACADISDGLLRDLGNICTVSGCHAVIDWELVPLSPATKAVYENDNAYMELILSGGDDYELVLTGPEDLHGPFTRIGTMNSTENAKSPTTVRKNGEVLAYMKSSGYEHGW